MNVRYQWNSDGRGTLRTEPSARRRQALRPQAQASADPARRRCRVRATRRSRPERRGRRSTVYRTKRRFVEEGLEAALSEEPRPGARAQAHRQGGSAADRDGVLEPAAWPRPLDAGAARRRDGAPDRTRQPVARDDPAAARREAAQAVAEEDVVHSRRSTPSTSPAWRTCSTSTPKPPTRGGRSSASTRARRSSSARSACRSPPRRGQPERFDYEYVATAPPTSSCSSTCIGRGGTPRSPTSAPPIDFAECMRDLVDVHYPEGRDRSASSSTTSRPTPRPRSTRPSRQTRPAASCQPARVPLHAEARQLAQHGRDRDRRDGRAVPRPPHRQPLSPRHRNRRLAAPAQSKRQSHQLDVLNRKGPRQNGPGLSKPHIQRVIITVSRR